MTDRFSKKILSTVIAAGVALPAMPVLAQIGIEEIVVTARKREESILKVPVTASVLAGDVLDQYGIGDVKGVSDRVPGLNFGSSTVAAGVQVSMRGVGTSTFNASNDQSVALVSDGVQFTQGIAYMAATFDMAQAEVLKGPQALFFGKAAPAGVISIRTADPSDEAEVILRGGYEFEGDEQLGEVILSGPVSDTLGLRLAAKFSDKEGVFENQGVAANHPFFGSFGAVSPTHDDFPNTETLLIRGTAVWDPMDNFKARLKLNYNDYDQQGHGGEPQLTSCPDGFDNALGLPGVAFIGGADCTADDKDKFVYLDPAFYPAGVQNGGVPFQAFEQTFGSLELDYDMDKGMTLTSVTGFYDLDHQSMLNITPTTQYGPIAALQGNLDREDFTQEFRLTSDYDGAVNFMAGVFYHDGESDYLNANSVNQAYAFVFQGLPTLGFGRSIVETEAMSVFGQVLWEISPEFELGVGARWTDEERSMKFVNLFGTLVGGSAAEYTPIVPEISSSNWSPEVSLTYTPTDNLTIYGNLKQAYKSGSFNSSGSIAPGDDVSFDDERIRGGEIGLKSRLADDNLALNASAYFYKYDDMQVEANTFDPTEGSPSVSTINAGAAEIYGIDLDLTYAVPGADGLTLYGAANYNKAEYTEFNNAQCWDGQLLSEGCNIDLDGNGVGDAQDLEGAPLLRAPEWTANVGFDYETDVAGDLVLRLGANLNYSDSYSAGIEDLDTMYQDSYTKLGASVGLASADDQWKVELIGDNINDEYVFGNCVQGAYADVALARGPLLGTGTNTRGPAGLPEVACFVERGRSLWVRFTWNLL